MAVGFKQMIYSRRTNWWTIVKASVEGEALTEVRGLKPEKIHQARVTLKKLQGETTSIDYTMMEQALNNVIFFSGNDDVELEDLVLEHQMLSRSFTDDDNPRD